MSRDYLSARPAPVEPATTPCDLSGMHRHFLAILPRIETHAQIRFQHLRCPGKREDAIAEVIAVCWRWFLRLCEQGKDVNSFVMALADYAVRHVRSGRRLCGQEKSSDVLSPLTQRQKDFTVEPLPPSIRRSHENLYSVPRGQDMADAFEERLRDNTVTPPPDAAAFRIDYPLWLSQLGQRNAEVAQDMALDHSTLALARKYRISPGRISQLRRLLHQDWLHFHGELP